MKLSARKANFIKGILATKDLAKWFVYVWFVIKIPLNASRSRRYGKNDFHLKNFIRNLFLLLT